MARATFRQVHGALFHFAGVCVVVASLVYGASDDFSHVMNGLINWAGSLNPFLALPLLLLLLWLTFAGIEVLRGVVMATIRPDLERLGIRVEKLVQLFKKPSPPTGRAWWARRRRPPTSGRASRPSWPSSPA